MCRAAVFARAGHVTARHFCDWLDRRARHSRGRLRMPQSQEASDVRGDEEGRKRGRSSGTQLSSFSHLDRSDGKNVDAQRARCHRKELGGMEGAVIGGRNSRLWLCEAFMYQCGFSAAARQRDPLGGAMQYGWGGGGQASHDERSS
ncbi:hypothetical protein VE00_03583 [Pseudogymnoascus sp. WSF 3629]|nr:hypothetical protein VE00_03583 [Pseudogymnoascus sp. WSF 3629]